MFNVLLNDDGETNTSAVVSPDFVPGDTRFGDQLHLLNTTPGGLDVNIIDAWDDYTGEGVTVTVIDAGFDFSHSDLAPNYNTLRDYDFSDNDFDASPVTFDDNHGTSVIGLIGAAANGTGAVGTAFDAELIGFRVEFVAGVDQQISGHRCDGKRKRSAISSHGCGQYELWHFCGLY